MIESLPPLADDLRVQVGRVLAEGIGGYRKFSINIRSAFRVSLSRIHDGLPVGRHRQTQRAIDESVERAEEPVSAGLQIEHMEWRIGAGIAGHVIHALTDRRQRPVLDARHQLPGFAAGERHRHEGRVGILRLEQQVLAVGRLAREWPARPVDQSLGRPPVRGHAPEVASRSPCSLVK